MWYRTVLLVVVLIGLNVTIAEAQQRKRMSPDEMAKRQTEMMTSELDLSADESEAIEAINLKYALKLDKMRDEAAGDRDKMRSLRDEMISEKDKELQSILNEEQFKKYKQLEEERIKEMRNGQRGGRERR